MPRDKRHGNGNNKENFATTRQTSHTMRQKIRKFKH